MTAGGQGTDGAVQDGPGDALNRSVSVQTIQVEGTPGRHHQVVDVKRLRSPRVGVGELVHQLDVGVVRQGERPKDTAIRDAGRGRAEIGTHDLHLLRGLGGAAAVEP